MMEKYSNKIGRIPDDWDFVNAKDCISLESGMRPKEYVTDVETDIPSLGGENIDEKGCLVFENIRYISPSYYKKMKKGQIKDNDILINKDGANTGKVAYSKIKPFPECAVNEHVFLIRNDGTFVQQYLFYCLLANFGKQQILKKVIGSAQEGINNSFTKGIILPKPSLSEQSAIAAILSKVDEAIASVQASISAAERLKKSLMQNLLTGRMKPDGTLRKEDEFYLDEKFGKVPKGWEVKKLGEEFDIFPTASYSRSKLFEEGNCKYIHYGDIHTKFDTFLDVSSTDLPYVSDDMIKNFVFLKDGDIVIADTSEDYEGVGKLVEIKNVGDEKVISGLHTLHIRTKSDTIINGYKGYMFNEERVMLSLLKYVTGIKVYSISKSCLARVLLPIPTKEEQEQIKSRLDAVNLTIQQKKDEICTLERLKKSLMQNLLTGRVRVKEKNR